MALPRALRRRRLPGTMRASSPTEVCSDAWPRPSRLVQNVKFIRRGGIYCARRRVSEANRRAAAALRPEIPPANLAAAQGPPGRCEHRPLQGVVVSPGSHFPGWPRALPPFVGADSISARGAFAPPQTGPIWNRPLQGFVLTRGRGRPGWPKAQNLFVGAGFIPPADLAAAQGPRDDASIVPYRGLWYRRVRIFPVGRGPCHHS